MKQNVEVKMEEKEVDINLETNYRLIELYVLLYKKMNLENQLFNVDSLFNSHLYKAWKRQYDKKINCNTFSYLKSNESKIIFEILIDLAEMFTSFQRDLKIKQKQVECFSLKDKSSLLSNGPSNKKANHLYLIELFTRYNLNNIDEHMIINSNIYNNFIHDEKNKVLLNNFLAHDKMRILVDLILLLENKLLINNVKNRSFIK